MNILCKEARLMPLIWLSEVQQLTNRICNRISLWEPATDSMMTGRQELLFRPISEHRQRLNYLPTVSITEHSGTKKVIRICVRKKDFRLKSGFRLRKTIGR